MNNKRKMKKKKRAGGGAEVVEHLPSPYLIPLQTQSTT
jgi:hypothetical protein